MPFNDFLEWKIENLSCWDIRVHGRLIKCPQRYENTPGYPEITFSPRDFEVHFDHPISERTLMYILTSDRKPLTYGPYECDGDDRLFKPHLSRKEVLLLNMLNEDLQEDTITLRFVFFARREIPVQYERTKIDVYDTTLSIPGKLIDHKHLPISIIEYPRSNGRGEIRVFASKKVKDSILQVSFQPRFGTPVLVFAYLSVERAFNEKRTVKKEEVLFSDSQWTISITLTSDEAEDNDLYIILRVKIVPPAFYDSSYYGCNKKAIIHMYPQKDYLARDFKNLLKNQDFSDFLLKCGDASFPVHRNILSVRSPVFKTMLSADMREAASGCMAIEDLDPQTLGLFLTHLYTGTVGDVTWDSATNLFYAADKYQVSSLLKECSEVLTNLLTVWNVCDLLSLAERHQSQELVRIGREFLSENTEVFTSDQWKKFKEDEPLLEMKHHVVLNQEELIALLESEEI